METWVPSSAKLVSHSLTRVASTTCVTHTRHRTIAGSRDNNDDAVHDPSKVKPGMIFIISTGDGTGHTGLVESVSGGKLVTIEGNTNDDGSREGIGVFRRTGRSIDSINRGFIDYSA